MYLMITKVSQEFTKNGDEYKKVTGTNTATQQETTKSVFNNLESKWELLEEGRIVELKMEKHGQYWNVTDISPASAPEPNETPATVPTQDNTTPVQPIAPQEKGMWWKELGESLRYGLIDHTKPHGKAWKKSYFIEMKRVLNLPEETE